MLIKRNLYHQLKAHLNQAEISLVIGPRQVGKTTLIKTISQELLDANKRIAYFNLDIEDDAFFFQSQSKFLTQLKLLLGNKKAYVFVDEVQRKENAGQFFKGLYDMQLPYKFILTGSGSVELKEKISESLAGRKQIFEMSPVSFLEFLDYKTDYQFSTKLEAWLDSNPSQLQQLFEEYLKFGGYPRVILAKTLEQKRLEIQEIYKSYLEKDIIQLLKIKKSEKFTKLVIILASQIGDKINVNELSNTLKIDRSTLQDYLWYLEKTYIIKICRPYFTNPRSELSKAPLYYFVDLGLRNYALHRFTNFNLTLDGGHLFENFIFNFLRKKYTQLSPSLNYWRTKSGAEMDLILKIGQKIIPIEAKYQNLKKAKLSRSFHSFIKKYAPDKAYLLNLNLNQEIKKTNTKILFRGLAKLLTEDFIKKT